MGEIADYIVEQYASGRYGMGPRRFYEEADPVEYTYTDIVHETPKAWLLRFEIKGKGREIWLPKSQCDISKKDNTVLVPEWLTERNEL